MEKKFNKLIELLKTIKIEEQNDIIKTPEKQERLLLEKLKLSLLSKDIKPIEEILDKNTSYWNKKIEFNIEKEYIEHLDKWGKDTFYLTPLEMAIIKNYPSIIEKGFKIFDNNQLSVKNKIKQHNTYKTSESIISTIFLSDNKEALEKLSIKRLEEILKIKGKNTFLEIINYVYKLTFKFYVSGGEKNQIFPTKIINYLIDEKLYLDDKKIDVFFKKIKNKNYNNDLLAQALNEGNLKLLNFMFQEKDQATELLNIYLNKMNWNLQYLSNKEKYIDEGIKKTLFILKLYYEIHKELPIYNEERLKENKQTEKLSVPLLNLFAKFDKRFFNYFIGFDEITEQAKTMYSENPSLIPMPTFIKKQGLNGLNFLKNEKINWTYDKHGKPNYIIFNILKDFEDKLNIANWQEKEEIKQCFNAIIKFCLKNKKEIFKNEHKGRNLISKLKKSSFYIPEFDKEFLLIEKNNLKKHVTVKSRIKKNIL